jgi:hypothetical protein
MIELKELVALLNDTALLNAMEAYGVDKWPGMEFVEYDEVTELEVLMKYKEIEYEG